MSDNRVLNVKAASQPRMPVPADETDTEGARRALDELGRLEARRPGGEGATIRMLKNAVRNTLERGEDSVEHYLACRLGASLRHFSNCEVFARIIDELAVADVPTNKNPSSANDFWHNELLLHLAAQMVASGIAVRPVEKLEGVSDPDLICPPNVFVEFKHRARSRSNGADDVRKFLKKALEANQIRRRDPDAVGIMVVDFGAREAVREDWEPRFEQIREALRTSGLLHAVVVHGLIRGDPASWLCMAQGINKRTAAPSDLAGKLKTAFPFGEEVTLGSYETFGVLLHEAAEG